MAKSIKKYPGYESFERMNFLYQLSKFYAAKNTSLSSYYGKLLADIGLKTCLKMHTDMKRQMCKMCRTVLVNEVTKETKIITVKNLKYIQIKCKICNKKIRFKISKQHQLWLENPDAVVAVLTS